MDKRLLSILCCPVTHKDLQPAQSELMQSINTAIRAGELVNRDGVKLTNELTEALITDDGKIMYPVSDGIPVLLEGESVGMEQIKRG